MFNKVHIPVVLCTPVIAEITVFNKSQLLAAINVAETNLLSAFVETKIKLIRKTGISFYHIKKPQDVKSDSWWCDHDIEYFQKSMKQVRTNIRKIKAESFK